MTLDKALVTLVNAKISNADFVTSGAQSRSEAGEPFYYANRANMPN